MAIAATTIGGVYQWRSFRFRSKLKSDLEILKSYRELVGEDKNYEAIKIHINETIAKAYPTETYKKKRPLNKGALFLFILSVLSSLFWLNALIKGGFGFLVFLLFSISNGIAVAALSEIRR
jgi:hypothetical protein